MVSFQCETCGDILTKKKLDGHLYRCRNTSFTCLDCHTQFGNYDYRSHTSCISEAQKYQGALYKEPKPKTGNMKTPRPATVEDIDSPGTLRSAQIKELKVPPPAPTPPSAAPQVNVFDYLVQESGAETSASSSSSYVSAEEDSDRQSSPEPARHRKRDRPAKVAQAPPPYSTVQNNHEPLYTYGSGPVEPTKVKYNSAYDLNAHLQGTPHPQPAALCQQGRPLQTPGNHRQPVSTADGSLSKGHSDRKRKRSPLPGTEFSRESAASLQTGLTGGLNKLLTPAEEDDARAMEVSPLSPKKRSKHSREDGVASKTRQRDEDRSQKHKEVGRKQQLSSTTAASAVSSKEARRMRRHEREPQALEAPPRRKAIEYNTSAAVRKVKQSPYQSHSEFFLGLIDKDHLSVKGQSIWGTLKTFHEGRQGGTGSDAEGRLAEEKRLLKGLRCKINKHGDIVLFSRREAEED